MGARKQRSTLSALELLTGCVQTAWRARPGCVVSMLSLDLGGAFDNVSHDRLLWIMRTKGYPAWIIQAIYNFLKERRTKIAIPGFTSDWITTETGIPQGSPLSPVLFLFFISELLSTFQRVHDGTLAFGFVDDTNIVAWGDSAQDNCRRL
jgi:retron-type reverse transcriptase